MDLLTVLIVCLGHTKQQTDLLPAVRVVQATINPKTNPLGVWHVHQGRINQVMDPLFALIAYLGHIN